MCQQIQTQEYKDTELVNKAVILSIHFTVWGNISKIENKTTTILAILTLVSLKGKMHM